MGSKLNFDPYLIPNVKISYRKIVDLYVKGKTVNFWKKHPAEFLYSLGTDKDFLKQETKTTI